MSSAEEIGRLLRDAREERGLDLLAVHDRLSRPITQLEALESGDLARLPDQALALSTLRRYAVFLGLDGDALALRMIDAWSARPPADAPSSDGTAALTNVVAAVSAGPDHLRAFTQTGQVPKVGAGSTVAPGGYGFGVTPGPPTGSFPVVPHQEIRDSKRAVARARRRLRAPAALKVTTWLVAVLVVAVVAGFAVYQWRPQWLAQSHILRVTQPGTSASGAPHPSAPPSAGNNHRASAVTVTTTAGTSATYAVDTSHFTVALATSGDCWVQVISSSSPIPLVSGVQPGGKRLTFPAKGTMTVEVGSSAVVVGVFINGKSVFLNAPQATPFTYVFAPASG